MTNNRPVMAVDIGGSKLLTALVSPEGEIIRRDVAPTKAEAGYADVIKRLGDGIERVLTEAGLSPKDIDGIGVACAGGIDTEQGMVVTPSPNLADWHDVPLRSLLRERFPVPIAVVNDASAAALGEHRYGAGKGCQNLVLVTLGTGIGGGIVINGKLYLGARGAAGEIGHMSIDTDGPACGCGGTGCLELLASGTAVANDAVARLQSGGKSVLAEMSGGNPGAITAEMVAQAAQQGDPLAKSVLDKAAHYLGVGLVNLVNIFNPEVVVLGGGMAALGEVFTEPAIKMIRERAFGISAASVRVVTAALNNDAGVYGAAAYVRDMLAER